MKAKAKAKKKHILHHPHAEKNLRALTMLLILLLAFGVFLLFFVNQDAIRFAGNFTLFLVATFVGMGLLIGLLFLVSKPADKK